MRDVCLNLKAEMILLLIKKGISGKRSCKPLNNSSPLVWNKPRNLLGSKVKRVMKNENTNQSVNVVRKFVKPTVRPKETESGTLLQEWLHVPNKIMAFIVELCIRRGNKRNRRNSNTRDHLSSVIFTAKTKVISSAVPFLKLSSNPGDLFISYRCRRPRL